MTTLKCLVLLRQASNLLEYKTSRKVEQFLDLISRGNQMFGTKDCLIKFFDHKNGYQML